MPRYLVLDPRRLQHAILGDQITSDERSAVEAVPSSVDLPDKVTVVRWGALEEFIVIDATSASPPPVVVRPSP